MSRQQTPNRDLLADTARLNLLTNGGFEIWQRGNGPLTGVGLGFGPDKWQGQAAGGVGTLTQTRESTIIDSKSLYSSKVIYTSGAGDSTVGVTTTFGADATSLRGLTLTLSIRVYAPAANRARLFWYDAISNGGARAYGSFNTLVNTWETITVTFTPASAAVQLIVGVEMVAGTTTTLYLDNAMLVPGSVAADYAPLHPADDLARCQRYYEIIGATASEFYCLGMAFSATGLQGQLTFKQTKAVIPTINFTAASNYGCKTAGNGNITATVVSGSQVGVDACCLSMTVASGLVAGNASNIFNLTGSGFVAVEANP